MPLCKRVVNAPKDFRSGARRCLGTFSNGPSASFSCVRPSKK